MKRESLLALLLLSAPTFAADLTSTRFEAFDQDLAQPAAALQQSGDFSVGIGLAEGKNYRLDPSRELREPSRSVTRTLRGAFRLPWNLELGLGLHSHSEASAGAEKLASHPSQGLGSVAWVRWSLWQSSELRTALTLQYEPGLAFRDSFDSSSQDKTALALSQDYSPMSWASAGAFVWASRRDHERFRSYALNDERGLGLRLSLGPTYLHGIAGMQSRSLELSRLEGSALSSRSTEQQWGLGSDIGPYHFTAYAVKNDAGLGTASTAFALKLSYVFGGGASTAGAEPKEKEKEQNLKSFNDAPLAPGEEADEFQLLERQNQADKINQNKETLSERAERELIELREKNKKQQASDERELKSQQQQDDRSMGQQIKEENATLREYKDDVDEEINQYSLPDNEELNWNGLRSK